jgi:hypothetical protein
VDWALLYLATGGDKPFSDPIYFGIAASAHNANSVATNVVSGFGATPAVSSSAALTLALLDYRRGDFQPAADWCRRLLAYPECNAVENSTARVILALSSRQLHQMTEAREQIEQAREAIEKKFSRGLEPGNRTDGFWFEWVLARELLQESNAAIH